MNECMNGGMDKWTDGQTDGSMQDGSIDGSMDGGWTERWMVGYKRFFLCAFKTYFYFGHMAGCMDQFGCIHNCIHPSIFLFKI